MPSRMTKRLLASPVGRLAREGQMGSAFPEQQSLRQDVEETTREYSGPWNGEANTYMNCPSSGGSLTSMANICADFECSGTMCCQESLLPDTALLVPAMRTTCSIVGNRVTDKNACSNLASEGCGICELTVGQREKNFASAPAEYSGVHEEIEMETPDVRMLHPTIFWSLLARLPILENRIRLIRSGTPRLGGPFKWLAFWRRLVKTYVWYCHQSEVYRIWRSFMKQKAEVTAIPLRPRVICKTPCSHLREPLPLCISLCMHELGCPHACSMASLSMEALREAESLPFHHDSCPTWPPFVCGVCGFRIPAGPAQANVLVKHRPRCADWQVDGMFLRHYLNVDSSGLPACAAADSICQAMTKLDASDFLGVDRTICAPDALVCCPCLGCDKVFAGREAALIHAAECDMNSLCFLPGFL